MFHEVMNVVALFHDLTPKGPLSLEGQNGFWAGSYDLNF